MRRGETGQGAVEVMFMICVVCIALVAAAYTFIPIVQQGVRGLALDVEQRLDLRANTNAHTHMGGADVAGDLLADPGMVPMSRKERCDLQRSRAFWKRCTIPRTEEDDLMDTSAPWVLRTQHTSEIPLY